MAHGKTPPPSKKGAGSDSESGVPVPVPYSSSRRSRDSYYERINTPPPEELNSPATLGYVHMVLGTEMKRCSADHAETHHNLWQKLTGLGDTMGKIQGGLKLVAWLGPVLVTILIAILVPLIRWAVKGAIAEELDKRMPPQRIAIERTVPPSSPAPGPMSIPMSSPSSEMSSSSTISHWEIIPSAQAKTEVTSSRTSARTYAQARSARLSN